jgi:hypothetical protein
MISKGRERPYWVESGSIANRPPSIKLRKANVRTAIRSWWHDASDYVVARIVKMA